MIIFVGLCRKGDLYFSNIGYMRKFRKNDDLLFTTHSLTNSIFYPFILPLGDEILAINGKSLQGMSHDEAINEFRAIKQGPVILRVAKREHNFDQEPIVIVKE